MDDIVLNKVAALERCVARVREVFAGDERNLREDLTRQDSIILNLQRACETSIDLAMHLVRRDRLGIPQESRDAFTLLADANKLARPLAERLQRMVGFRNVAVHDYQALNIDIVLEIIRRHLDDLLGFGRDALGKAGTTE